MMEDAHATTRQRLGSASNTCTQGTSLKGSRSSFYASLRIALIVAWGLVLFTSTAIDVVLDVFQREVIIAPSKLLPAPLFLCSSVLVHVVLIVLVMLLGRLTRRHFHFFQPFTGGDVFVWLQLSGYTTVSLSVVLKALLVQQQQERYGAFMVLAVFGSAGHAFLMWSLHFFRRRRPEPQKAVPGDGASCPTTSLSKPRPTGMAVWWSNLSRSPAREIAWLFICGGLLVMSSSAAEYHKSYRPLSIVVTPCLLLVSFLSIQYVIVPAWLPGDSYHVFIPIVFESTTLYMLQLFGNGLLLCAVYMDVVVIYRCTDAPPSWHLSCGLLTVVAIAAHLLVVYQLRVSKQHRLTSTISATPTQPETPYCMRNEQMQREASGFFELVLPSLFSVLLCGFLIGILYVRYSGRYALSGNAVQGLAQLEGLIVALMFILPLFTHVMGVFIYGNKYRIWQPFKGSVDFVALQAVGWACYGVGFFFATLHLNEDSHINFLVLSMTFVVVAQFFIHVSVALFSRTSAVVLPVGSVNRGGTDGPPIVEMEEEKEGHGAKFRRAHTARPGTAEAASPVQTLRIDTTHVSDTQWRSNVTDTHALLSSVVNGELLLAIALGLVSLLLRVVVVAAALLREYLKGQSVQLTDGKPLTQFPDVPIAALVGVAILFGNVATPIAQVSMRGYATLFSPRSMLYVALETVGWGTYIVLLTRSLVLWNLYGSDFLTQVSPMTRVGLSFWSLSTFSQSKTVSRSAVSELTTSMEGAAEGFVWCFPFLCVVLAGTFEMQEKLRAESTAMRVRNAIAEVKKLCFDGQQADTTEGKRLDSLLHQIAGPRCRSALSTNDGSIELDLGKDPEDTAAVHEAARYATTIMCIATTAAFCSAAFLATAQPRVTLSFGVIGSAVLSLSCFSLHVVYGARIHCRTSGETVYKVFKPFVGGHKFVMYQALGWVLFTCVVSLMLTCLLEGRGAPIVFAVMAGMSVVAQLALLWSVPAFDESKVLPKTIVQRNPEGVLAAIAVLATLSFFRLYDMTQEGRATTHVASSLLPVILCSVSVCTAIPLGIVSLQRQAELYGLAPLTSWFTVEDEGAGDDDDDNDDGVMRYDSEWQSSWGDRVASDAVLPALPSRVESSAVVDDSATAEISERASSLGNVSSYSSPCSRSLRESSMTSLMTPHHRRYGMGRQRRFAAVFSYVVAVVLAFVVVSLLPFALLLMTYTYSSSSNDKYEVAIQSVEWLLAFFMGLVLLPIVAEPLLRHTSVLRDIHSAFCCFALYSIPTYTVVGGLSMPLIYNCYGTWLFTINMVFLCCFSTLPYVHVMSFLLSVASLVYVLLYHLRDGLHAGLHPFSPIEFAVDVLGVVFWLWYRGRYTGRPEVSGRLQSTAATKFFQRHFFRGMCHYFSIQVLVSSSPAATEQAPATTTTATVAPNEEGPCAAIRATAVSPSLQQVNRVDLNNPQNQYLFSFHPHGVFPGSSIIVPNTELWERTVGYNTQHFVSTHCADVVFSAPLMREFPLCLGAMSVGRRGIESSLRQGNSPLIITGGQAEMLLTKMSDTEMHLVCHHTGFIRIAMNHKVPLVPVISFSESNIMDNVHCVPLQRWFLKRIGFPFPTLPYGRWFLPLPTAKPVTIVVGEPVLPLPGREDAEDPACVEELRIRYFECLERLFYKYREAARYPDMVLYLHHGVYAAGVPTVPPASATADDASTSVESAVQRASAAAERLKSA